MSARGRSWIVVMALAAVGVVTASGSGGAGATTLSQCTPFAHQPQLGTSAHHYYGQGEVDCDQGFASYSVDIRLSNASGVIFDDTGTKQVQGCGAPCVFNTPSAPYGVACAGNNVHSFIWENFQGTVKSSQTNNILC